MTAACRLPRKPAGRSETISSVTSRDQPRQIERDGLLVLAEQQIADEDRPRLNPRSAPSIS